MSRSELGLVLCLCRHELRGHIAWLTRRPRQCRHPDCRCVRFTEAPFAQQQLPLFEATTT